MQQVLSEPMGIKYTVGGFLTYFLSLVNNYDITQVIGFVGLVLGLVIQISSWHRNRKADKLQEQSDAREKEADARDIAQYNIQMKIFNKQLAELEGKDNANKP